ncbi:hypothetical protein OHC33_006447 [Knufia fluminis]|uniref:Uncharacterized protein n=1 Tax=Knufia fluminis TaxID=191047 RepID=A0AAN8ECM4_9EURO|nr:hypothetical protein OHC33_006447 [Knufia fluminis]
MYIWVDKEYMNNSVVELWIADGLVHKYQHRIVSNLDTYETLTLKWVLDLPEEEVKDIPVWEFSFLPVGYDPAKDEYNANLSSPWIIIDADFPTTCPGTSEIAHDRGLSRGAKAGIAVGAVVGACLMFALGFLLAFLRFKKNSSDEDQIARPPTPLAPPPAFTSQQHVNKVSLTPPHSGQHASSVQVGEEEDTVKRLNLSPRSASLDGSTVRSPIEMPGP